MEVAAHKLSAVTTTRSQLLTAVLALIVVGCAEKEPEPRPATPVTQPVAQSRSAAEVTGWPAGIGRLLVLRLTSPADAHRLVVPELGDRRFADSAIALKAGDSVPVALIGRRGKVGDALLRIIDAETGTGSCVTWPSVELGRATYARASNATAWRVAVERDSVVPVTVDTTAGRSAADSLSFASAVNSLLGSMPGGADSTLRGIPFTTRRTYAFRVAGTALIAAELVRASSSEADPREERLFVIGEHAGAQSYSRVFSRRMTGRADSTGMVELLSVMTPRGTSRGVIALGIEEASGVRLQLLERSARLRWRVTWSSAVSFC